jgi:hypothetical protein
MRPEASRRGAALMLTGTLMPSGRTMKMDWLASVRSCSMQPRRAHEPSHRLEWNTSQHLQPRALSGGMPVMRPAARLKKVMFQSVSTVNTPSARDSMMASQGMSRGKGMVVLGSGAGPSRYATAFLPFLSPAVQAVGRLDFRSGATHEAHWRTAPFPGRTPQAKEFPCS